MKLRYIAAWLVILVLSVQSCKDIFEPDLTDENMVLLAPKDSLRSTVLTQTFWWQRIEGATWYNLQVVSVSFENLQTVLLDTNVSGDKFSFTLTPGTYQWRMQAFNNSSTSGYATNTLFIDSTTDLSQQVVILQSPVDNHATNNMTVFFQWDTLYNADDYRFELRNSSSNFTGSLLTLLITDKDSLSLTLDEGKFDWGVRGQNAFSNSAFTVRTLTIDTTPPNNPVLIYPSPANTDTVTGPAFTMSWSRGVVSGSAISDSLIIYSDTTTWQKELEIYTADTTYNVDTLGIGVFYWSVRSFDAAGNNSGYSNTGKFTVQ